MGRMLWWAKTDPIFYYHSNEREAKKSRRALPPPLRFIRSTLFASSTAMPGPWGDVGGIVLDLEWGLEDAGGGRQSPLTWPSRAN